MASLTSLVLPFTKLAVSLAARAATREYLKQIDDLSTEWSSAVAGHWFGSSHALQLLEISARLDKAVSELTDFHRSGLSEMKAQIAYSEIKRHLNAISDKLHTYNQHRENAISKSEFIAQCATNNPDVLLQELHHCVTVSDVTGRFLEDIIDHCDYLGYKQWQEIISVNAINAYIYWFNYMSIVFCDTIKEGEKTAFEEAQVRKSEKLIAFIKDIAAAFSRKSVYSKSKFLSKVNSSECELAQLLHKFLKDHQTLPFTENQTIAVKVGDTLKQLFPWYEWAVIVAENSATKHAITLNPELSQEMFFEKSNHVFLPGSAQPITNIAYAPESTGRMYGILTCSHKHTANLRIISGTKYARRITVFWSEEKDITRASADGRDALSNEICQDIKQRFLSDPLQEINPSYFDLQTVPELKACIQSYGFEYVAQYVALQASDVELGTYPKDLTWPRRLEFNIQKITSAHLILWLSTFRLLNNYRGIF